MPISDRLKEIADIYALGCISKEDVEFLIQLFGIGDTFDNLPKEFHDEVTYAQLNYDAYCATLEEAAHNH